MVAYLDLEYARIIVHITSCKYSQMAMTWLEFKPNSNFPNPNSVVSQTCTAHRHENMIIGSTTTIT